MNCLMIGWIYHLVCKYTLTLFLGYVFHCRNTCFRDLDFTKDYQVQRTETTRNDYQFWNWTRSFLIVPLSPRYGKYLLWRTSLDLVYWIGFFYLDREVSLLLIAFFFMEKDLSSLSLCFHFRSTLPEIFS